MNESSSQYPPARLFRPKFGGLSVALAVVAHDVIVTLRPRVVVELGSGGGNTCLALCQAMEENGVTGACFAIDPWPDEVMWAAIQRDSLTHGGSRLRLIRTTAAAGAAEFADGSVGLLHIRGPVHEAALESWIRRMRPGGVIVVDGILPGSGCREAGALWQQVRRNVESWFELPVEKGIGIARVAPGATNETTFIDRLFLSQSAGAFFSHYYSLVVTLASLRDAASRQDAKLTHDAESLRVELRHAQSERLALTAEYRDLHARIASLTDQLARQEERLREQQELAAEKLLVLETDRASERCLVEQELKKLADHWSSERSEADRFRAESERLAGELARLQASANQMQTVPPASSWDQERQQLQAALQDRERAVADLKSSLSWRLTAPLRALAGMLSGQGGRSE